MLAAAAVIALSGCSNDEIANVETSEQNAIGFNVVGSHPGTRAMPITSTNITGSRFDVFAFISGEKGPDALFMGKHEANNKHKGVEFYYSLGKWNYAKPEEQAFWPVQALDFFAIHPSVNERIQLYSAACENGQEKIQYGIVDEFAEGETQYNQDVMYATAFEQTKATNGGTVKLHFYHALTQVVFQAKTELASMEVKVGKVKIHNIKKSGVFTIPEKNDPAMAEASYWALDELQEANSFHVHKRTTPVVVNSNTTPVWISNVNDTEPDESRVTILHPQTVEKWTTTPEAPVSIVEADQQLQCYLSIECNIKQNGHTIFCGQNDDLESLGTIYVPLAPNWNPGMRYIYTLVFGGGFDATGNPILTPVKVETDVQNWIDHEI